MSTATRAMLLIAFAMTVLASGAHGKSARPTRHDVLTSLKIGQWIRIEGTLMKDRTIRCNEIKVLTGDFLDDDWAITGQIDAIDLARRRLTIAAIEIDVADDAVIEGSKGQMTGLAGIRRGMIVEVDGTYLKNRTFLAMDVDDESGEISFPPGERRVTMVGRVEAKDPAKRRLQALGSVFILTDETQVKSVIR